MQSNSNSNNGNVSLEICNQISNKQMPQQPILKYNIGLLSIKSLTILKVYDYYINTLLQPLKLFSNFIVMQTIINYPLSSKIKKDNP